MVAAVPFSCASFICIPLEQSENANVQNTGWSDIVAHSTHLSGHALNLSLLAHGKERINLDPDIQS